MSFWNNKPLAEVCSFFESSIWSPLSLYGATLFSRLSSTFPDQWPLSKEKSTQTWHLLWATPDPLGAGFRSRVGWPVRMNSSQPNSHCGFHSSLVSLAWKKTFLCVHWLSEALNDGELNQYPNPQSMEVFLILPHLQHFPFVEEDSQDVTVIPPRSHHPSPARLFSELWSSTE